VIKLNKVRRKMMKNKKMRNKLVITLSIIITALFIGTSMTTAVARIISESKIESIKLERADDPICPTCPVGEPCAYLGDMVIGYWTIKDGKCMCPASSSTSVSVTNNVEEVSNSEISSVKEKTEITQISEIEQEKELISVKEPEKEITSTISQISPEIKQEKELISVKEPEKEITSTISKVYAESESDCPLCALSAEFASEDDEIRLSDVLTDEQIMQVGTIFVLAAQAESVYNSYKDLSSSKQMFVKQESLSQLDSIISRVNDEKQKKDLQIVKSLILGDYSKLEKSSSIQGKYEIVDAIPMPHASATYVSTSTSSSSCIGGKKLATPSEVTACEQEMWSNIGTGLLQVLGLGLNAAGDLIDILASLNLGEAALNALIGAISNMNHPALFGLAMALMYGDDLMAAGAAALGAIAGLITAGLLALPEVIGALILGGLALDAAVNAYCKWRDCDGGNWLTGSVSMSMSNSVGIPMTVATTSTASTTSSTTSQTSTTSSTTSQTSSSSSSSPINQ
jgi:hypothetical protein